jgi:hypothetical protein
MVHLRRLPLCGLIACFAVTAPGTSLASSASVRPSVRTESAVFIERAQPGNLRVLEPASQLSRGDRVVTVVSWHRLGGEGNFTITNPLPRAITYQASASDSQDVSVDGGHTWGKLGELRIGDRVATPEDVTHMRWRIASNAATRGRGQIVYSGIVR